METFKTVGDVVSLLANLLTIAASAIAIYLFFKNRKKISAAIDLLLNFSYQTTLSELKEKVERLNEYNANDPNDAGEIKNILHEIYGQIKGNAKLSAAIPDLVDKIEKMANGKNITEARRRSIISEMRETLRHVTVGNIGNIAGINHE